MKTYGTEPRYNEPSLQRNPDITKCQGTGKMRYNGDSLYQDPVPYSLR